jgi:putative FmdB family regulatory protein
MPTYDYICTSCQNKWELEQRIVEDPIKKCPKCGKNTAKRQISSGAGFILKGGGWYADGYGSKKPSTSESKSDEKSPKADAKSEAKTEKSDSTAKADTPKKTDASSSSSSTPTSPAKQGSAANKT